MAQPKIVRRDKASSHPRERGRFYNGIITSVRSDGRVNVKIPALNVSYGPVMPLNTTDTSRYIKDDNVLCGFTDENNSQIVVFGSLSPKYDVFATADELSYLDGVTSAIQAHINAQAPSTQTTRSITASTDTPSNSDNGKIVIINTSSGSVTITINGSLGLSAGQKIDFVWQGAATAVSFTPSGLTGGGLSSTPGLNLQARYSAASLLCTASNTYILIGDLAA